jgi:hypothetical protein
MKSLIISSLHHIFGWKKKDIGKKWEYNGALHQFFNRFQGSRKFSQKRRCTVQYSHSISYVYETVSSSLKCVETEPVAKYVHVNTCLIQFVVETVR